MKSIVEVKKELKERSKLKLRDFEKKEESVQEFIVNLIKKYNKTYYTLDAETDTIQCSPGCRRSLGDIYRITSYYYPKVRLRTVISTLVNNCSVHESDLKSIVCGNIDKRVYSYAVGSFDNFFETDENGWDNEFYNKFLNTDE